MYQRDYILRMIENMTRIVGRYMLLLKDQERQQETLFQLEELYGRLMVPPSKLLIRMKDEELLSLVSINGTPDLDKTTALALLLKEEGKIYDDMELYEEARVRFLKSLYLLLVSVRLEASIANVNPRDEIEELRTLLKTYRIPSASLYRFMDYYENEGLYGKVEDALFELLEDEPTRENLTAGRRLFERLMALSDDALEAGGLSRAEVEEGMRTIERLFSRGELFS